MLTNWLQPKLSGEFPAFAILAILLGAGVLRFWDLGGPSLWTDELYSVSFSRLPQGMLWSDWMVREPNPPLYYALLQVWISVFGESELALRALSATLGMLSVFAMFLVGRALHSNGAGLIAACLTAVSAQQLQNSQQVRAYMLTFFAAALAIYALIRLTDRWREDNSTARSALPYLALYTAASATAFYAHTTMFILPVLANVYVVWMWAFKTERRLPEAGAWLAANAILTLVCAWWLLITIRQVVDGANAVGWLAEPTVRDAILKTSHVIGTRSIDSLNLLSAVVFGALIAWGAWRLQLERRLLVAIFGIGVPLLLFAFSFIQPMFMERTIFWAQAVYFPCLAAGILSLPVRRAVLPVAIACIFILLVDAITWRDREYREPWREIAAALRDQADSDDVVLVYDADVAINLQYYCRNGGCTRARVSAMRAYPGKATLVDLFPDPLIDQTNVSEAIGKADRIWVLRRGVERGFDADPEKLLVGLAHQEYADVLSDTQNAKQTPGGNNMKLAVWRPISHR